MANWLKHSKMLFVRGVKDLLKTARYSTTIKPLEQIQLHPQQQNIDTEDSKLNIVKQELEELKVDSELSSSIPKHIEEKHWTYLLSLPSRHQRLRFYRYLRKIEETAIREAKQKVKRRQFAAAREEERKKNDHLQYSLWNNSIFCKVSNQKMNRFYDNNLLQGVLFGQNIVFDLGFDQFMDLRETNTCIGELKDCYLLNRLEKEPFNLHFVNANYQSYFCQKLLIELPHLSRFDVKENVSEKSYLDLFPKERLVYLTPDSKVDLEFNLDDVYVIGALVDAQPRPRAREKAEKEGLRMARLPLSQYLEVKNMYQNLIIKHVMKILCRMQVTQDWKTALEVLPKWRIDK